MTLGAKSVLVGVLPGLIALSLSVLAVEAADARDARMLFWLAMLFFFAGLTGCYWLHTSAKQAHLENHYEDEIADLRHQIRQLERRLDEGPAQHPAVARRQADLLLQELSEIAAYRMISAGRPPDAGGSIHLRAVPDEYPLAEG